MPVKQLTVAWGDKCQGLGVLPSIAIPIGLVGAGWYFFNRNKDQLEFVQKVKKPSWYLDDPTTEMALDFGVVAPVGYAAYLICKEANVPDRQVALGLYGASLLSLLAGIPVFSQIKNPKAWAGALAVITGFFGATAISFYKLNPTAGLLLVPMTAWMAYGALGKGASTTPTI